MLKRFRKWLFGCDLAAIDRCMTQIATQIDRQAGVTIKYQELLNQVQPLRDAINTMEGAGIRRHFGGVIDIDYDRLLNALGRDGEAELARTIALRMAEGPGVTSSMADAIAQAARQAAS